MGKIRYAGRERDKLREYLEIAFFLAGHKTPLKGYGFSAVPVLASVGIVKNKVQKSDRRHLSGLRE